VIPEFASGRLKTYTEEDHDQVNLKKIHTLVRNAKRIVFLGTSYHPKNMELLISAGQPRLDCEIWGTCRDPDETRLKAVQQIFMGPTEAKLRARLESFDCETFLYSFREAVLGGLE
jgi:hypothetical protein